MTEKVHSLKVLKERLDYLATSCFPLLQVAN